LVCCLDLEGILVPEIWINVAEITKVDALSRTTRDEPDYDRLMKYRLKILKEEGIKLRDIQRVIERIIPLPGAKSFLDQLRSNFPVIILSDTFYEFAAPLMKRLGQPHLICNELKVDKRGYIRGYRLRQRDGKGQAVKAIKAMGFKVQAVGDSYNDVTMLKGANRGFFFKPPAEIAKRFPRFKVTQNYNQLTKALNGSLKRKFSA
jgi:phosphoserine / homoserine phosphotransferase